MCLALLNRPPARQDKLRPDEGTRTLPPALTEDLGSAFDSPPRAPLPVTCFALARETARLARWRKVTMSSREGALPLCHSLPTRRTLLGTLMPASSPPHSPLFCFGLTTAPLLESKQTREMPIRRESCWAGERGRALGRDRGRARPENTAMRIAVGQMTSVNSHAKNLSVVERLARKAARESW